MNDSYWALSNPPLIHYGTKGMRWGIRRYQNKDGSYTLLGKKRRKELTPEEKVLTKAKTRSRIRSAVAYGFVAAYVGYTIHNINMVNSNTKTVSKTDSVIKQFSSTPASTYEKSWADYAWEEVMK